MHVYMYVYASRGGARMKQMLERGEDGAGWCVTGDRRSVRCGEWGKKGSAHA